MSVKEDLIKMEEPTTLASTLAEFISQHGPGSRMHSIGSDLLRAHTRNRDRRAAVLKHADLAKRVTAVLRLRRPSQWAGYIPPAVAIYDDGGIVRHVTSVHDGHQRVYFNAANLRSIGEVLNNSPERAELVEISREAWNREHEDLPQGGSSLPEPARHAEPDGAASAAVPSPLGNSSASCQDGDGLTPPASSPNGHAPSQEGPP